jgi:ubiquinone/menaquinone biosynthesis C-methylase UbiE
MLVEGGFEKGRILDAGCGAGEVLIELAHAFPKAKLVGVDLSQPLLDAARSSAQHAGLSDRVTFEKGDVQAMPFEDGSFDVVISLNMLHYVDYPVAMLNEIERVLAPGGMFGLGAIKRSWLAFIWPIFRMAYNAAEARELLRQSKLRTWELKESFLVLTVAAGGSVGLPS